MSKLDDSTPDAATPIIEQALGPKLTPESAKCMNQKKERNDGKSLFSATLDFLPSDEFSQGDGILNTRERYSKNYKKPKSANIARRAQNGQRNQTPAIQNPLSSKLHNHVGTGISLAGPHSKLVDVRNPSQNYPTSSNRLSTITL